MSTPYRPMTAKPRTGEGAREDARLRASLSQRVRKLPGRIRYSRAVEIENFDSLIHEVVSHVFRERPAAEALNTKYGSLFSRQKRRNVPHPSAP